MHRQLVLSFAILLAACCVLRAAADEAAIKTPAPTHWRDTGRILRLIPAQPVAGDAPTTSTGSPYAGKVLLIVNVASKCGFTPQYEALEKIYRKYKGRGFVVLGFPANDFKNQEPGTEAEIVQFCKLKYDVTFPIFKKIHVIGTDKAPLYQYLTGKESLVPGEVKWNFEKFLIGPDGKPIARFPSKVKPDSPEVIAAIEQALAIRTAAVARNFRNKFLVYYDPDYYYNPPFMLDSKNLSTVQYDPSNGTTSVVGCYKFKY